MASGNSPGPAGVKRTNTNPGILARAKPAYPGLVGLSAKDGDQQHQQPSPNVLRTRVVTYARQRLNQVVGNGECFTLADNALRNAGAKSAADFGQITPQANYRWGTSISLSQIRPGDIIQFRDYELTVETTVTEPDSISENTQTLTRPHHTAIVDRVGDDGAITVLEQNAPPGSSVTRTILYFTDAHTNVDGTETTITVSGTSRFYRPQPR